MSKLAQDTIKALQKKTTQGPNFIRIAGELLHKANSGISQPSELDEGKTTISEVREIEKLLLANLKQEKRPTVIMDFLWALGQSRNKSLIPIIKKYLIRNKFPRHLLDSFLKK